MNLIVAVDQNWGIGKDNKLLATIPGDMRFFRRMTMNKVVVLGRKTLGTLPGKVGLQGRTNIVLSRRNLQEKNITVVHNIDELRFKLEKYESKDIYVIGGESVYNQLLPYCDVAYITKIEYSYDADSHFPNLDEMEDWDLVGVSEEYTYFDMIYRFNKYMKQKK